MKGHDVTIRPAVPQDEALLSALIAASYATLDDGSYDSTKLATAMPVMARANPKLLASGTYYVAEIDGEAAGCGGWTVERPGTGEVEDNVGHIRHFATHPAHARKGVARALLDHCLDAARGRDISRMRAQATLPAVQFYMASGFRRLRQIEVAMAPGVTLPAVEMERAL